MKKLLLISLVLFISIFSCKKDKTQPQSTQAKSGNSSDTVVQIEFVCVVPLPSIDFNNIPYYNTTNTHLYLNHILTGVERFDVCGSQYGAVYYGTTDILTGNKYPITLHKGDTITITFDKLLYTNDTTFNKTSNYIIIRSKHLPTNRTVCDTIPFSYPISSQTSPTIVQYNTPQYCNYTSSDGFPNYDWYYGGTVTCTLIIP